MAGDVVPMLVWVPSTALLAAGAWRASQRLWTGEAPLAMIMHLLVLAWSVLVISVVGLGVLAALSSWSLLISVNVISATLLLWRFRRSSAPCRSDEAAPGYARLWLGLFLLALTRLYFDGLRKFPTDWDTLTYHLPLVVQWLHSGCLNAPADAFWYNPGNNELWTLWIVAPFSGDYLHALSNLPATVLFACAAVELAICLGATETLAHIGGMASVATWPVFRQLVTAENDVAVAALFLTSLCYVCRYAREGQLQNLVFACASVGLLAGTKYYALGYAAVAAAYLFLMSLSVHGAGSLIRASFVALIAFLLLGSYWYLRNLVVSGSPVYPKGLSAGSDLWHEMRPEGASSSLFGHHGSDVWSLTWHSLESMTGPCHLVGILLAPIFCLWFGFRPARNVGASAIRPVRVGFVLVILATFVVLGTTPNFVEIVPGTMDMLRSQYLPARFGLSFLGLVMIGTTVLLSELEQYGHGQTRTKAVVRIIVRVLFFGLAGAQLLWHWHRTARTDPVPRYLLAVNLVLATACIRAWVGYRGALSRWLLLLCALALVILLIPVLETRWHARFASSYEFVLDEHVLNAVIWDSKHRVCVCDYRYYPLFGSYRQIHAFRPLWLPDVSTFLTYLRRNGIDLVLTLRTDTFPQRRYTKTREWMESFPQAFVPIVETDRHILFRIRDGALPATIN